MIDSSGLAGEMTDIPCAFSGNQNRLDICGGTAVVFFRAAKGTIWPLCRACSDRHKELMVQLVATQHVEVASAVGATFDIPLTDSETLQAYRQQDPTRVQRIIELADKALARRT